MFLRLQTTSVFNLFSCMIVFIGNSLSVENMASRCSTWNSDQDSVNSLDASVLLWERNDCPNIDCAIRCDRDPSCRSFFHHPSLEMCLASSSYKRGLPTDKLGQQGWIYYTKKRYCDEGYIFNQTLGLCYKYYSISKSVDKAMITCEEDGAKLMTIKNEAEFRFILEVMKKEPTASISIGIRAVGANREWLFWDGKAVSYLNWSNGQPDNYRGIEDCVEIFYNAYNDCPCSKSIYFVCQRFI